RRRERRGRDCQGERRPEAQVQVAAPDLRRRLRARLLTLVPTLRVGTLFATLRVADSPRAEGTSLSRGSSRDAERRVVRSHAERGNEGRGMNPLYHIQDTSAVFS